MLKILTHVQISIFFLLQIKRPYFHVKPLDKKQIKNWNDYLDFEISEGDPVRIIHLFERSLVACALYEDFWCRYGFFMEKHVQNVMDGKYKDSENEEFSNDENRKDCEDVKVEISLSDSVENENENNNTAEASKEEKAQNGLDIDKQVIDESITDVKDVKNDNDSVLWGSEAKVGSDLVRDANDKIQEKTDSSVVDELVNTDSREQSQTKEKNGESIGATEIMQGENQGQDSCSSEPLTLEQLKSELYGNLSLNGRVLKCPPLTPQWIMSGVSWEDVRHIFRRGSWIHCPSKPGLLMQWAEFEETQGKESDLWTYVQS